MTVRIDSSFEEIDWSQAKADLAADDFDNGLWGKEIRFVRAGRARVRR